jgi:hypothetical protein
MSAKWNFAGSKRRSQVQFGSEENKHKELIDFGAVRIQSLSVGLHTTMDWNRLLSGLLAAIYIITAFAEAGAEAGLKVVGFVILPLACIWFGDEMGDYIGQSGSGYITQKSPGFLVCILGWLLLLFPIVIEVVFALAGSKS